MASPFGAGIAQGAVESMISILIVIVIQTESHYAHARGRTTVMPVLPGYSQFYAAPLFRVPLPRRLAILLRAEGSFLWPKELFNVRGAHLCSLFLFAVLLVPAQEFLELQKKASEFTLSNGLHFIVLERHESPVVSFHTWVNAGSVHDPGGETGLAHMFEHLAFKGTEAIGTHNWPEEKKALDAIEEAYDRLQAEVNKGLKAGQIGRHPGT